MSGLRILDPGLHATIQDGGRHGYQSAGVAICGALDQLALRLVNLLLGNAPGTGAIECLYRGASFRVEAEAMMLATAGGEAEITVQRGAAMIRVPTHASFEAFRGDTVRIGAIRETSCLYIGAAGGFDIAPQLGSVSTDTRARLGGLTGAALVAGDLVPAAGGLRKAMTTSTRLRPVEEVRVVLGPQDDYFDADQIARFLAQAYHVEARSNRMAMALRGEAIVPVKGFNIISDAIPNGSIQIAGDGQPAILLADRQTTGGYPKIATVISADLAALGRKRVGTSLRFRAVTAAEAREAAMQARATAAAMALAVVEAQRLPSSFGSDHHLLSQNLISGVVDACEWT